MVARVLFLWLTSWGNMTTPHPAGDHKGPPSPSSSALAPTDVGGWGWLPSWGNRATPRPAGDHKGPPSPSSSSLAPTDVGGCAWFPNSGCCVLGEECLRPG